MKDKIIDKIKKCGFDDIRLLSEGGHGQVFFVRRNRAAYVLKSYFSNSDIEAKHEEEISRKLHGEGKGNPYGFKSEVISDSDGTFFLLNHTDEGKTIEEIKENSKEKLSLHEATEIMIKSCEAIMALHNQSVIHFDVKPTNLYLISEVSYVKSIDYGSAVEIRKVSKEPQKENYEEIYNKIISSSGYCSTAGYMTKRLQEFCEKRELFSRINTTKEQQISLVEDENRLGPKEDIYALICTYWFLLTGLHSWGVWSQDFCYLSTEQKIRLTLEKNNIPTYLIPPLVDLFLTIDEPSKNSNAEVPFKSVDELIKRLNIIKEIVENKEFHPEVCEYNAIKKYNDEWSKLLINFDPDLLCKIQGKNQELSEIILDKSQNQNLYLISEGGSGKTVQMLFAYKKLLDVFTDSKIVPLFIPMNRFNASECFIKDYIIENYVGHIDGDCVESNRNKIKEMIENESYSFCLFIDGINEISVSVGKAYAEIEELSMLRNISVVLSSKTDFNNLPDFNRIKLKKLDVNIVNKKTNGRKINKELRELLGLPFYLTRFLEIPDKKIAQLTSTTDLLREYYNWLIEKTNKSVDNIDYENFCNRLLYKFLPRFAYNQYTSAPSPLVFKGDSFSELWEDLADKKGWKFKRECIETLENFGIIRKIDNINKCFAFDHQNTLIFFIAKYIFDSIEENQDDGDAILVDISETLTLKMVGEFMGEHKFVNKKNLEGHKNSTIEEKLDKYRGIFEDVATTKIVAKYIDIIKLCMPYMGTLDFSDLDLSATRLMGYNLQGADFSGSLVEYETIQNGRTFSKIESLCHFDDLGIVIASGECDELYKFELNNGDCVCSYSIKYQGKIEQILNLSNGVAVVLLRNNKEYSLSFLFVSNDDLITFKKAIPLGPGIIRIKNTSNPNVFMITSVSNICIWEFKFPRMKLIGRIDKHTSNIPYYDPNEVCYYKDGTILFVPYDNDNQIYYYDMKTNTYGATNIAFNEKICVLEYDKPSDTFFVLTPTYAHFLIPSKGKECSHNIISTVLPSTLRYYFRYLPVSFKNSTAIIMDGRKAIEVKLDKGCATANIVAYVGYNSFICFDKLNDGTYFVGKDGDINLFDKYGLNQIKPTNKSAWACYSLYYLIGKDNCVVFCDDRMIKIFQNEQLKRIIVDNITFSLSVEYGDDSVIWYGRTHDNNLWMYSHSDNTLKSYKTEHTSYIKHISISKDKSKMATISDKELLIWDIKNLDKIEILARYNDMYLNCTFLDDKTTLLEESDGHLMTIDKDEKKQPLYWYKDEYKQEAISIYSFCVGNIFISIDLASNNDEINCYSVTTFANPQKIYIPMGAFVRKCNENQFCVLFENTMLIYEANDDGMICEAEKIVFRKNPLHNIISDYSQEADVYIATTDNEIAIFFNNTIMFYDKKGRKKDKSISPLINTNVLGANFKNAKLSKETKKIIKQNGGIV